MQLYSSHQIERKNTRKRCEELAKEAGIPYEPLLLHALVSGIKLQCTPQCSSTSYDATPSIGCSSHFDYPAAAEEEQEVLRDCLIGGEEGQYKQQSLRHSISFETTQPTPNQLFSHPRVMSRTRSADASCYFGDNSAHERPSFGEGSGQLYHTKEASTNMEQSPSLVPNQPSPSLSPQFYFQSIVEEQSKADGQESNQLTIGSTTNGDNFCGSDRGSLGYPGWIASTPAPDPLAPMTVPQLDPNRFATAEPPTETDSTLSHFLQSGLFSCDTRTTVDRSQEPVEESSFSDAQREITTANMFPSYIDSFHNTEDKGGHTSVNLLQGTSGSKDVPQLQSWNFYSSSAFSIEENPLHARSQFGQNTTETNSLMGFMRTE